MISGNRKRVFFVLLGAAVLAVVVAVFTHQTTQPPVTTTDQRPASRARTSGAGAEAQAQGGTQGPTMGLPEFNALPGMVIEPEAVTATMAAWRRAILGKDAEAVEHIDDMFRGAPAFYSDALQESARTDSDPRVRAFSTRVLGNTKRKDAADTLRSCLKDASEHVRANAAWALGQVNDQSSLTALGQLATHDLSQAVRHAATNAIEELSQLAASNHPP